MHIHMTVLFTFIRYYMKYESSSENTSTCTYMESNARNGYWKQPNYSDVLSYIKISRAGGHIATDCVGLQQLSKYVSKAQFYKTCIIDVTSHDCILRFG